MKISMVLFGSETYMNIIAVVFLQAGLPENKLLLALEPEAASLCCWSIRNVSPDGRTILTPGLSYTVLDMGGNETLSLDDPSQHPFIVIVKMFEEEENV